MHQLWRMQHGEIFQKHQPHIAVVMIGTNDLGAASCLGKGEAPILQAAAGTADRCNCIYLHSRIDSFYFLSVSLLRLDTQLLGKHYSRAAVVHANDQSIIQSAHCVFGGSQQTITATSTNLGWATHSALFRKSPLIIAHHGTCRCKYLKQTVAQ